MIQGRECQKGGIAIIRLTLATIFPFALYSADSSTIPSHRRTSSPFGSIIIITNRLAWGQMGNTVFGVHGMK